jgi:two-component system response regulator MprA
MHGSILVVDDHPDVRKVLRVFLESMLEGCVCREAADGVEAVEKASEFQPDLVILDLAMPRMNGLEAARILRASGSNVIIFLFTLYSDEVEKKTAEQAGITAIFSKGSMPEMARRAKAVLADPGRFTN